MTELWCPRTFVFDGVWLWWCLLDFLEDFFEVAPEALPESNSSINSKLLPFSSRSRPLEVYAPLVHVYVYVRVRLCKTIVQCRYPH